MARTFSHCPQVALTVQAAAYATGELIGGKNTLVGAGRFKNGTGVIQSLTLVDQANQKVPIDLVVFNADPSNTTFTENGALDVADADMAKITGVISILASDYVSFADNAVASRQGIGQVFQSTEADGDLYFALVSRGAPTYAATTDLIIKFGILQD